MLPSRRMVDISPLRPTQTGCNSTYTAPRTRSTTISSCEKRGVGLGRRPFQILALRPLGRPHFRYCASKALAIEWLCDNWRVWHLFVDALDGIGIAVGGDE